MHGPPVVLESKIDRLEVLATSGVRAARLLVNNMRRPGPLLSPEAVRCVHLLPFGVRRSFSDIQVRHRRVPLYNNKTKPSNSRSVR